MPTTERESSPAAGYRRDYLSARETTRLLDVKLQTLYAYVSRGLIRSTAQPGLKARMYLRADVERVHARALARSGHGPVAADAMNHGAAIIPTAITEITPEGPRYRGHLATALARDGVPFEAVAQLLWTGELALQAPVWPVTALPRPLVRRIEAACRACGPLLELFALAVLQHGLQPAGAAEPARELIALLVGCAGLATPKGRFVPMHRGERIDHALLRALGGAANDDDLLAMRALLALLADHELQPGTLSVRVSASAGATLHGCIASGLCASAGRNVAHRFEACDDFLAGGGRAALVRQAVRLHAQGETPPGFGHPLYPQGDPRASLLLEFIREQRPTRALLSLCDFIEEVETATGLRVRHELPVVALTRAMGLPCQAASAIFAVARMAGWVAHIEEQRASGQLMRPRARYIGALKNQA